jgi:hypothetical protein
VVKRVVAIAAFTGLALARAAITEEVSIELGKVSWERNFDVGLARAQSTDKPALVLFQEVPGCSTCSSIGREALSSPLLVEAIESEFVPIAVLNNRGGTDAAVLASTGEPAWNNPVVRFFDASGSDVIPRKEGVWTAGELAARMVEALEVARRPVPGYLTLASAEARARSTRRAVFAMGCYWRGEACLGALDGVIATRSAQSGRAEVVEVFYDPRAIDAATLSAHARQSGCVDEELASDARSEPASPADQKYYLHGSPLARLELTPLQAARANAALAAGEDASVFLSPRQKALLSPH